MRAESAALDRPTCETFSIALDASEGVRFIVEEKARPATARSALELRNVAKKNPFLAAGADPERVHVAFLADKPSAKAVAALDHDRSPPDEFTLIGREIYLHTPKGLGQSKLTNAYFDRALETTSTVRNWRTLLALCELCDAAKS